MTAKLTICSSYFALPGGQKVYNNVDLAQTTIQSIKEKVRIQITANNRTICENGALKRQRTITSCVRVLKRIINKNCDPNCERRSVTEK